MHTPQPTTGDNPSENLNCPYCNTILPPRAVFCRSCGKRVKYIGGWEIRTEDGEDDAQEQDVDTVRVASLSQKHLKRWQAFQSLQKTKPLEQLHLNGPPLQDAEAPAAKPTKLNWLWPMIIILSAIAASLVNFVFTDVVIRPVVVFWFLFVCPGMLLVHFLRLKEPVVEWTLALALSLAVDAIVAAVQLYAGKWSPTGTLSILIGLCIVGATVQLAPMGSIAPSIAKPPQIVRLRKLKLPLAILLARVERFWKALQPARWLQIPISRNAPSATGGRPNVSTSESSGAQPTTVAAPKRGLRPRVPGSGAVLIVLALLIGLGIVASFFSRAPDHTVIPLPTATASTSRLTPASTVYPLIAGTYSGTIDDLSVNVSTSLSLTRVQQNQGKISGYLIVGSKLQESDPFSGTIDTAKHLQFTVTDAAGHAIFFFEGVMQSATWLSGDYYQCSSNPTHNSQCSRASGSYGIWSVVLVS